MVLARVATGSTLAYVHMGSAVFGEAAGRAYSRGGMKETTLVWHDKQTARTAQYHDWAAKAHCYTEARDVRLNCFSQWTSCSGARWRRCLYLQNYTACPARSMLRKTQTIPTNRTLSRDGAPEHFRARARQTQRL